MTKTGDENVEQTVLIVLGQRGPHSLAGVLPQAGLRGDILECTVPVIQLDAIRQFTVEPRVAILKAAFILALRLGRGVPTPAAPRRPPSLY